MTVPKILLSLSISVLIISCNHQTIFSIDQTIETKAKAAIVEHLKETRRDSLYDHFATHLKASFYENDSLVYKTDTLDEYLNSYYYWQGDTLHLLVHLSDWAARACYAKIYKGNAVSVNYYISNHEGVNYYRMMPSDTSSPSLAVPCHDYKLIISEIPDTLNKQTVYGFVNLNSKDFYQWIDPKYQNGENEHTRLRASMTLYFRAHHKEW